MKINEIEMTKLSAYDVSVKPYLSYDEIQKIVNEAIKYSTWSERQEVIDYLMLCYATDIPREDIDELGHTKFLCSGLIESVRDNIMNYYDIYEAIQYETSVTKQLAAILDSLPDVAKKAVAKVSNGNNK